MVDEARDAPGAGDAAERTARAVPRRRDAPDQEELQRRLEEQLRQIRVQDLLLESVASILNLVGRRIGKEDERDLEQARIGIDAVRAVVDLLDEAPREQVREALSQVQMLYARETQGDAEPAAAALAGGPRPKPSAATAGPGSPESGAPEPRAAVPGPRRYIANPRVTRYSTRASRPDRPRPLLTEKTLTEDLS